MPSIRPLPCFLAAACAVLAATAARAVPAATGPLLHEIFADHAVVQRDRPIEVFGQARPREAVVVAFGDGHGKARADATGHWRVTLPAQAAGGPYTLTASARSGATASRIDVLVGDVYLCSGQSNMELPVSASLNSAHEISNAADPAIRLLTIAHATAPVPLEHFGDTIHWDPASPQSASAFSAACFYFARELRRTEHVPIGLIASSWGGSRIEPWISAHGLSGLPGHAERLALLGEYAYDAAQGQRSMAALWQRWWHASSPTAPWQDTGEAGWRDLPLPMRDWKTWGVPELAQHDGMLWFRRRFTLTAAQASGEALLSIGAIDEVDQTWLNGQPVGNTFGYATERTYPVPAGVLHAGENLLVINVVSTWDAGGMYGPPEHLQLEPVRQAAVPLAGGWQYQLAPEAMGYPPRAPWESVSGLSSIYNAMIAPLAGLPLRGVLWYQGESNASEADHYAALLTALFQDWRALFRADLPFLVVQLPNFGPPTFEPAESAWASLREAQRRAVQADGRAALTVTIDVGEPGELHPPNKQAVGARLARAARHLIYGAPASASGALVRSAQRQGGEIVVTFSEVEERLRARGSAGVIGFERCGPGGCRYTDARLDGSRVLVDAGAEAADRIRYCWADAPLCNLYDGSGLPAAPFEIEVRK